MSNRTFGHKKAGTSTFSKPPLVSPHTPTLANPIRGFGLPTNNIIQTATEESTKVAEAQAGDEQSLLSEVIEQRSFHHDISRIPLRRPHEEGQVMRQEEESSSSTSAESNASQSSNTTGQLLDLITHLEQLHTHSNEQIGLEGNDESPDKTDLHKEGEQHLDTLSSGLNQLRVVAASNDETLKQRVLAAFTPSAMQTAQTQASSRIQAVSGTSLHPSSPGVVQRTPVNIATKSLTISSQQDAAEVEADQVAKAVTSNQSVTVNQRSPEANISRLAGGETLIALGTALLVADAEAAPVEVVAGPPGWAIGLGIAAVAVVAIGIGYAISSSSTDSEPVTEPAPDTSAPPIPVPVPIPKTRKYPDQTCEDEKMATLEGIMHGICDQGFSCSDGTEKLGRKKETLLTREQLLENIARAKACIKARQDIQDECFKGSTDAKHAKVIAEIEQALKTCEEKYIARHGPLP